MREYTPETITDAVLDQMSTTADPRLKEIMESAVRHLHAFARQRKSAACAARTIPTGSNLRRQPGKSWR